MKRVIVTGANGFIGASLIRKLIQKEVEVVALYRNGNCANIPESSFVKKVDVDLKDADALVKSIPGQKEYDALYHLAWQGVNGTDKSDPSIQLGNAQMAVNCAVLAKTFHCRKLLCAGTIAEQAVDSLKNLQNTSGGMIYGVAKHCTRLMLEAYCKNIGQDFVWMQFSNIYGAANKTGNLVSYALGQLQKNQDAAFGPALQPYDFIYVEDLIEAVFRLGENETKDTMYFIGSGQPRILKSYLEEIGEQYGRPDLIKIGARPDDGIIYTMDMFDISALKETVGDYISKSFTEGIRYTIDNY